LINIVEQVVWYDTFQFENTKWLCIMNDIVATMNNDKVLCDSFGLYPSYVAGILNSVKEIHFFVLCNKNKFQDYIEKCIAGKEFSVIYTLCTE